MIFALRMTRFSVALARLSSGRCSLLRTSTKSFRTMKSKKWSQRCLSSGGWHATRTSVPTQRYVDGRQGRFPWLAIVAYRSCTEHPAWWIHQVFDGTVHHRRCWMVHRAESSFLTFLSWAISRQCRQWFDSCQCLDTDYFSFYVMNKEQTRRTMDEMQSFLQIIEHVFSNSNGFCLG